MFVQIKNLSTVLKTSEIGYLSSQVCGNKPIAELQSPQLIQGLGSTACFRQDQDLSAKLFSDLAALCVQFRTESFDRLSTNPDMSFSNYCLLGEAVGIH